MLKRHNVNNPEMVGVTVSSEVRETMSRKKKDKSPMPAASAGLLRFFEEETEGVKIRPEVLMALSISLVVISVLAKVFF